MAIEEENKIIDYLAVEMITRRFQDLRIMLREETNFKQVQLIRNELRNLHSKLKEYGLNIFSNLDDI